jgi:hypothetical protein
VRTPPGGISAGVVIDPPSAELWQKDHAKANSWRDDLPRVTQFAASRLGRAQMPRLEKARKMGRVISEKIGSRSALPGPHLCMLALRVRLTPASLGMPWSSRRGQPKLLLSPRQTGRADFPHPACPEILVDEHARRHLRLDHQSVRASDAGLSPLWAEAKTEHASSCTHASPAGSLRSTRVTRLRRYYEPLRLPTQPSRGYSFPRFVTSQGTAPDLSGSWRVCRYPPSPTTPESCTAADTRYFTVHAGFALYGRLAALRFISRGRIGFTCVTADSFSFRGFTAAGHPVQCPVAYMANEQLPWSVPFNYTLAIQK